MENKEADAFTCVTCDVAFTGAELQRTHYKSEWHRYNLKRKIVELPIISIEEFTEKVQMHKQQLQLAENAEAEELFCKLCSKHFTTLNSFTNHKQSKRHRDLEAGIIVPSSSAMEEGEKEKKESTETTNNEQIVIKSDRSQKKAAAAAAAAAASSTASADKDLSISIEEVGIAEDSADWEDIGDDELDKKYDETKGIKLTECFFCDQKNFATTMEKCEHMAKMHSFYIPDMELVSDLDGLLKFLGIKMGVYHVCLWCSSKCYRDLLSVQRHMNDKGHRKMKFEGETLLEYADFYNIGDDSGSMDTDESFEVINRSGSEQFSSEDGNGADETQEIYELVLPSGVRIGHRSLFRYYKQNFSQKALEVKYDRSTEAINKYRAIANGTCSNSEIVKQRKDLACIQRWRARMSVNMGWKANKLQKHFRRSDLTF